MGSKTWKWKLDGFTSKSSRMLWLATQLLRSSWMQSWSYRYRLDPKDAVQTPSCIIRLRIMVMNIKYCPFQHTLRCKWPSQSKSQLFWIAHNDVWLYLSGTCHQHISHLDTLVCRFGFLVLSKGGNSRNMLSYICWLSIHLNYVY